MPNEPNQAMEEQLRAYAERRRQAAPAEFELDATARRQLQAEVRRVYLEQPATEGDRASWFGWLRVGVAAAVAMVIVFVSVRMMPREQPFLLTQSTEVSRGPEPASADGTADDHGDAASGVVVDEPTDAFQVAEARIERASRPTSREVRLSAGEPSRGPAPVASAPAAAQELTFAATTAADEVATLSGETGQDFLQVRRYRRNPNSPPPPQVLQSFKWVRNGDAIRVIDEDGSVYLGQIVATAPVRERRAMTPSAEGSVPVRDQVVPLRTIAGQTGERFAVSGTNRTMQVPVAFEGFIVPQSVAEGTATVGRAKPGAEALRIQGQAVVGSSTRMEIVAEPREP